MIVILLAILILIVIYVRKYYENVRKYPKGPIPLPLIGNLHQVKPRQVCQFFEKAQAQYGDVFTVFVPSPTIVLMSHSTCKEAFCTKGEDFTGRPGRFPYNVFMNAENGGLLYSQGENWKEQRKTAISILRQMGMGKNVMEEQIKSPLDEFMKYIENIEDKSAVDLQYPIQVLVANIVNKVLFGYHYNFNDCQRLMDLSDNLTALMDKISQDILVLLVMKFPLLARLPVFGWYAYEQYMKRGDELLAHVREDVRLCEKTFDKNEEPSCFVHAYMQRMEKNQCLTEEQMVNVCIDILLAGMDTSAKTLRWAMLLMANNIEVQEKIRAEIHSIIGKDGNIAMKDKRQLPYTSAAIAEVQRVASIVPINIPHRTVRDTSVAGHSIPNDTLVLGHVDSVMKNSEIFDEPEKFKPERFLMEDGVTPNRMTLDHVVPFSIGCRVCPGEGLAKMDLFLSFTTMLQKYHVLPPNDAPLDLTPIDAIVRSPKAHKLKIVPV